MWLHRSDTLAPLTKLCSKTAKWQWGKAQQTAFENMKKTISREALLAYPDFNKRFDIHTDASHTQLGTVISQDGKPIVFYSRKLNDAQTHYTTMESKLLAIVETLEKFCNILLGQQIRVYTDHKNLTYKNFNTERVMRWRLVLEEYGPELDYVKGESNIVADALSRLDLEPQIKNNETQSLHQMAELYGVDDIPEDAYPLDYTLIRAEQQKDKELLQEATTDPNYTIKSFRGGEKVRSLICYKGKILVPKSLRTKLINWYHTNLIHPGMTRTEQTISQHFYWKNMRDDIREVCRKCPKCQITKMSYKKYGLLPEKQVEYIPWERLCVDLIGPYTIRRMGKRSTKL